MMIRDDELESDLRRVRCCFYRTHAAVNSDDEIRALFAQLRECLDLQPIAFFDAMRNIRANVCVRINRAQHVPHNRGRHDAVHVVVAEDDDGLLRMQRRKNLLRRKHRIRELPRMLHLNQRRIEERLPLLALSNTPDREHRIEHLAWLAKTAPIRLTHKPVVPRDTERVLSLPHRNPVLGLRRAF